MKQKTVEDIRKSVSKYEHIFLFTVHNMRNSKLKDIRLQWTDSKFFFGKNKVIALALGKTKSDEIEDQLNLVQFFVIIVYFIVIQCKQPCFRHIIISYFSKKIDIH